MERNWYALYTRFKSEKIARNYFIASGIESYVPTTLKTKRYTRKIKQYEIPLITCYVFVRMSEKDRGLALQNPHVMHFVRNRDGIPIIPDHEIQLLKKITGEVNDVKLYEGDLTPGEEVEIIHGQLTGIKARILSWKNKRELLIELNHIGVSLRISIDPTHLRKVHRVLAAQ